MRHPVVAFRRAFRKYLLDFPWGLFAIAVMLLVIGQWVSETLMHASAQQPFFAVRPWLLPVSALAVLIASALRMYRQRLFFRHLFITGAAALVSGHWLALGIAEIIHSFPFSRLRTTIIAALVIVLVLSHFIHRMRHKLQTFLNLDRRISSERCAEKPLQGLVLLVSKPTTRVKVGPQGYPQNEGHTCIATDGQQVRLAGKDPGEDIRTMDALKKRHNWQQLLRAIRPHKQLKQIYLLGTGNKSEDCEPIVDPLAPPDNLHGSFLYLEDCETFLRPYLPGVEISTDEAVDFEDFNELLRRLHKILDKMRKRGFESSRIAIDVTGGQKTASIAGAVLTLNGTTVVQYVQTEAREEIEAYIYDLRLDSPPEFGHA